MAEKHDKEINQYDFWQRKNNNSSIDSLLKICIRKVAKNLTILKTQGYIEYLPSQIKNSVILYVTRVCKGFHDDDILAMLVNSEVLKLDLKTSKITDRTLEIIATGSPYIRELILNNSLYSFSKEVLLASIGRLKNLEIFQLNNCDMVDDQLIEILSKTCPNLDLLDLSGCKNLTDNCLKDLEILSINKLNLSKTKITDEFLKNLGNSKLSNYIEDINVSHCKITSQGLACLRWDKLKFIGFQGVHINDFDFIGHSTNVKFMQWTI